MIYGKEHLSLGVVVHKAFNSSFFLQTLWQHTRYFLWSDNFTLLVKKKSVKQPFSKTNKLAVIVFFPQAKTGVRKRQPVQFKQWCKVSGPRKAPAQMKVSSHLQQKCFVLPTLSHESQQDIIQDKLTKTHFLNCFTKDTYCRHTGVKHSPDWRNLMPLHHWLLMTPKKQLTVDLQHQYGQWQIMSQYYENSFDLIKELKRISMVPYSTEHCLR